MGVDCCLILEFKLDDWVVLKNIFTNINEIIDEVIVECTFDGLNFKGIDRGHICFFEGSISKELFDKYELEDYLSLYLDLYELVKILKRGNNKDSLVFKADMEVIKIVFENKNNRTFSLTQLDMSNDNMRTLPTLEYSVEFECDFDTIKNSLKDADLYSNILEIICEDNLLIFNCDGQNGNYKNECPLDNSFNGSYSAKYSIDWLFKIFNTKLNSNDFKIHMGTDYPMLIEMGFEYVKMNYLLAPRLGED